MRLLRGTREKVTVGRFLCLRFAPNPAWHFQHAYQTQMCNAWISRRRSVWQKQNVPLVRSVTARSSLLTARKILVGLFLLLQWRCPLSSNCHRFFSLSTIRSFSLRGFHYFESIICRDLWKPRRCSEVLMFDCISLLPRVVKISEYFLKYFSPPSTGKSRNSECAPSVVLCISPTLS